MMNRSLSLKASGLSRRHSGSARTVGEGGKSVPDYEKPLVKTGEARLWRALNGGDRVEVIHNGELQQDRDRR